MKLVIIGAPGAGKGTQSRRISKHYGIAYIATGDMLRDEIKAKSKIGLQVEAALREGLLVSDELIIEIVKSRLSQDDCKNGFLLDGFPRTKKQVEMLEEFTGGLQKAIFMHVPDEVLLERLTDRETCASCGSTYNRITNPTKVKGVCDLCGGDLMSRDDDNPEIAKGRLKKFHDQTEPLLRHYNDKGILLTINGMGDMDSITDKITSSIG